MIQHPSDETKLAQCDDSEEEENSRRNPRVRWKRENNRFDYSRFGNGIMIFDWSSDVIQSPFNRSGREMALSTLTINMESIRIDKSMTE